MIGVLATFTQTDKFDRATLAKIAGELRGPFEGMAGLRFKSFMLDEDGVQARNFYVWDDEEKWPRLLHGGACRQGDGDLWRPAQNRIPRYRGVRRQLWHLILKEAVAQTFAVQAVLDHRGMPQNILTCDRDQPLLHPSAP
ncbi:hypothetical protein OG741_01225 [Streptomyces sp. NBC_01410]|uniref:hypothetical protein n=1 Tax=Streptomyces sp. NBC_01410 TaxID=2903856 RepID=UPI00324AAD52